MPAADDRGRVFRLALCALAAAIGLSSVTQSGVNSALADMLRRQADLQTRCLESSATVFAALVSFSTGWIILVVLNVFIAVYRRIQYGERVADMRRPNRAWQCTGGCVGCIIMILLLVGLKYGGFALTSVLRASGMAISSCVLDQIGCAGNPVLRMTRRRAAGVSVLLLGATLTVMHEVTEQLSHLESAASLFFSSLPLIGGALLPVQAAINGALSKQLGRLPLRATLISFSGGVLSLLLAVSACEPPENALQHLHEAPIWAFTGGALGMLTVTSGFVLPPYIGYAALAGFSTFGTLGGGLLLDGLGSFGIAPRLPTTLRLFGVAVTLCGALLTHQKQPPAGHDRLVGTSRAASSESARWIEGSAGPLGSSRSTPTMKTPKAKRGRMPSLRTSSSTSSRTSFSSSSLETEEVQLTPSLGAFKSPEGPEASDAV